MSAVVTARIGDFCETGSGGTPSRENSARYYEGGTIPWVKSGELRESVVTRTEEHITELALRETSAKLVQPGAVLLAMYGATVGRLAILGIQAATNQAVCHIVPDPKKADSRYLFHALRAQVPKLIMRGVGGAQPNISQGIVKDLSVPLPILTEQRRIAELLDQAEALRAKRRAALAQLDTLTQSIFLDYFGDPATNSKAWPVKRIGDLLESASYGMSSKANGAGAYPILRMNNLTRIGEIDLTDLKFIDVPSSARARYLLRTGDVLFNRTNSADLVGKTAIYRGTKPMAYAGYLIRLRTNAENNPEYISAFLNTSYSKRMLRGMCKSIIGMANINAKEIQAMKISRPPLQVQNEFAQRIADTEILKHTYRRSLLEMDKLFASLQSRAFRGDL